MFYLTHLSARASRISAVILTTTAAILRWTLKQEWENINNSFVDTSFFYCQLWELGVQSRQILGSWWFSLFSSRVCSIVSWYCKEILDVDRRVNAHLFTIPAFFLITLSSFFLLFTFRAFLVRPASKKKIETVILMNITRKLKKGLFKSEMLVYPSGILYLYRGRRLRRGRRLSSPSPDSSRCSSFLPSSDWSPDSLSRGGGGRRRRLAQGGGLPYWRLRRGLSSLSSRSRWSAESPLSFPSSSGLTSPSVAGFGRPRGRRLPRRLSR